ncbi:MAG: phosphodiester glycosidase family protein, partial [Armatimonadetes bacterium]|nr:phosphodiester glycosidase family protein [Armatimonadota bacterium]
VEGLPLRTQGQWKATVKELVPEGRQRVGAEGEVLIVAAGEARKSLSKLLPGQSITLTLRTRGLNTPVELAAGGGPLLLRAGEIVPSDSPHAPRHPRTAVGFGEREIVLVTVDGRQPGWGKGMTLYTLAQLMRELGCTDALNLDGGGSTTAWVRGKVVNRPSDGAERPIANALLVRSSAPKGPLARLVVGVRRIIAVAGATFPLPVWLTDRSFNPVAADPAQVRADVLGGPRGAQRVQAEYTGGELKVYGGPGRAVLRLSHPGAPTAQAFLDLRVMDRPATLEVLPPVTYLCAGERAHLGAEGLDEQGRRAWIPQDEVVWQVVGEGLVDHHRGVIEGARPGAVGEVLASLRGAQGTATVHVAAPVVVEDFQGRAPVRFDKYPAGERVSGQLEVVQDPDRAGNLFCRITYDLGAPKGTRAAYLRLDRKLGKALRLSALVRARADEAPWLRVAVLDGNGTRHTLTLASKVTWSDQFKRVTVRLPDGMKPPIVWQSVYVVALGGHTSRGWVDVDDLQAERVKTGEGGQNAEE